jgi:GTPase SAR1 and related small G proteins
VSFDNTKGWLDLIYEHTGQDIVIMLVGTKSDLIKDEPEKRKVPLEKVEEFTQKYNLLYFETSAKDNYNIQEAFETLFESILIIKFQITLDINIKNKERQAVQDTLDQQTIAKIQKKLDNNFKATSQNNNTSSIDCKSDCCN